jgi:hypothetical protein
LLSLATCCSDQKLATDEKSQKLTNDMAKCLRGLKGPVIQGDNVTKCEHILREFQSHAGEWFGTEKK